MKNEKRRKKKGGNKKKKNEKRKEIKISTFFIFIFSFLICHEVL